MSRRKAAPIGPTLFEVVQERDQKKAKPNVLADKLEAHVKSCEGDFSEQIGTARAVLQAIPQAIKEARKTSGKRKVILHLMSIDSEDYFDPYEFLEDDRHPELDKLSGVARILADAAKQAGLEPQIVYVGKGHNHMYDLVVTCR